MKFTSCASISPIPKSPNLEPLRERTARQHSYRYQPHIHHSSFLSEVAITGIHGDKIKMPLA